MKIVIMLLTLVLMINSLYASNKFYFDNMQNQRNIMHKYYHAFIESHLTSNHKSILKVNYPPDYTDNLSTRYSFIQMYKIPVQTKFIVNLKDITNKNRRLAFYDNELSHRSNQKWHKHMQSIIVNAYHDFYNKSDFTPYLSMIFSGNFPQNSRPENYIDKIDKSSNNQPLFDFFMS